MYDDGCMCMAYGHGIFEIPCIVHLQLKVIVWQSYELFSNIQMLTISFHDPP